MTSKKRVLYITYGQFGYVVGSFYYAKYLTQLGYEVGVLCGDSGKKKIKPPEDVMVYYQKSDEKSPLLRRINLISKAFSIRRCYDIFVVRYFILCMVFPFLLGRKRTYLDFRTGSLEPNKLKNFLVNLFYRAEMIPYKRIFILSEELAKKFHVLSSKYIWLPLGADDLSTGRCKNYVQNLNLLYIGTLMFRNLDQAVVGFGMFYEEYKNLYEKISFHIVGRGSESDIGNLIRTIESRGLKDVVFFHGEKTHEAMRDLVDYCNCGVAYVPETDYYDHQPSTKIFEYNLSGLICVATSTSENKKVITERNGVLCHDNPESFKKALEAVYERRDSFDYDEIKKSQESYSWYSIVKNVFCKEFEANQ